jgi:shikimate kinase
MATTGFGKASNLILIGMPGAGKSTVGILLAKRLAMDFVDTDILIQLQENCSLQSIVDNDGYKVLRRIEEEVILSFEASHHVIATGGSAVYSAKAMEHLRAGGRIIFLNVSLVTLRARVQDYETRGLAKPSDQTLEELFTERLKLYRRFADISIDCNFLNHEEVCLVIENNLKPLKIGREKNPGRPWK